MSGFRIGLIGLMGVLYGCGTPEFRAEKVTCEAHWIAKIPPKYAQRLVTRTRYEQRPTGQMNCTTFGNQTQCNQVMTSVAIPYQAIETVDENSGRRDPQIAACTAQACMAKYGNAQCEAPKG